MREILTFASLCATLAVSASNMMTPWGEKVTSENAWREYPRPQMVRQGWTCLNGDWDYAVTSVTNTPGRPEKWDGRIRVPFALEAPLSGVQRFLEADQFLWYTRTITVHPKKGFRTLLHFDGVDFRAQVYIGHDEVTDVPHAGAQEPFTLDITDYVKDGENELTVCVWDPTDGFIQSRGKQERKPHGCHYTRVSGIWQSVWMETVPDAYIADYSVTPDIDKGEVTFVFEVKGGPRSCAAEGEIEVADAQKRVPPVKFFPGEPVTVKLPAPVALWSPETPALYNFTAKFGADKVEGYFAMRKFEVKKDAKGILKFHLNNKAYYPIGTLDQGWWPDGFLTPPSEDAMRFDIETLKKCGFNMMRKHIKVEPRRYYYLCDKIGILVFQDLPSCTDTWRSPLGSEIVKRYGFQRYEMKAMMDNLGKVPCIVAWIPYNEGWGQPGEHLTHAMLDFVRRYDRTRVVSGPSGCFDWEGGHLLPESTGWKLENRIETKHKPAGVCEAADTVDMHLYRGPAMFPVNDRRASFLGEFGGLGHAVSNHVWQSDRKIWGYQGMEDTATREGLLKTYLGLMDQVRALAEKGLAGSVYTQTTDVENEVNGLLTYDRKVLKYDADALKKAHEEIIRSALK